jgi:transcriptional regulator with XRE-family HTH domain
MARLNWDGPPHNRQINFSRFLTTPVSQVAMLALGGKAGRPQHNRVQRDGISRADAVRVGRLIRRFRTDREFTQSDLAARLRWTPSVISRAEQGFGLTRERLGQLAAALNIQVTALTSGLVTNRLARRPAQKLARPRRRQNQPSRAPTPRTRTGWNKSKQLLRRPAPKRTPSKQIARRSQSTYPICGRCGLPQAPKSSSLPRCQGHHLKQGRAGVRRLALRRDNSASRQGPRGEVEQRTAQTQRGRNRTTRKPATEPALTKVPAPRTTEARGNTLGAIDAYGWARRNDFNSWRDRD